MLRDYGYPAARSIKPVCPWRLSSMRTFVFADLLSAAGDDAWRLHARTSRLAHRDAWHYGAVHPARPRDHPWRWRRGDGDSGLHPRCTFGSYADVVTPHSERNADAGDQRGAGVCHRGRRSRVAGR